MTKTATKTPAQNPIILRCHRLMEAFTKSDDERDFYLDRVEGFIVYVDLDKPQNDLAAVQTELETNEDRYVKIPKFTFYETKKIMEGFVNEKVYDIDTKEKLLDIIQSKEARENFLEFIYDHHSELEKWQQYYHERSRIRIIEWLRQNNFDFVFEEDLDMPKSLIDKLKRNLFQPKAANDVLAGRKMLVAKAKNYYSNEALNPRPKRGRPPKQVLKLEIETKATADIYNTVPLSILPFLFTPDISSVADITFSSKFGSEEELLAQRRQQAFDSLETASASSINEKLAALRSLSNRWVPDEAGTSPKAQSSVPGKSSPSRPGDSADEDDEIDFDSDDEDDEEDFDVAPAKPKSPNGKSAAGPAKFVPTKAVSKPLKKNDAPASSPVAKPKAPVAKAPTKEAVKPKAASAAPSKKEPPVKKKPAYRHMEKKKPKKK